MSRHQLHICTIGGLQHGKTTVTRALVAKFNPSELDIEHSGEFRSCFFSIATGKQRYQICDVSASHIPKHLITQGAAIDGAILVVSAAVGVTSEVEKQIRLARFGGVSTIIPSMTKCDLVSDSQVVSKISQRISELLIRYQYRTFQPPIVLVARDSARNRIAYADSGVQDLSELMDRVFRSRYE
jgi:translation elongation factor EF-Tu-like GTPase